MGFSVTHLLVVLAIVMVLFGTKSLRNIGSDLGGAIKGFRTAVKVGEGDEEDSSADKDEVIEGEVTAEKPIKINV